jgi:diguanylate cyclase
MSDDAQRWKDKYLAHLEQQERLEQRWQDRLDLLRRGLVRSSLAAEGNDQRVDQCLRELREVLRRDDIDTGLSALIPRLEKAVLDSERQRGERTDQLISALDALVGQLQALPLPRDLNKALTRFARQLHERISQTRELPALLGEFGGLQGRALAELHHEGPRPGLLQRLFGGRDNDADAALASPAGAGTPPPAQAATPASAVTPDRQPIPTSTEEAKPIETSREPEQAAVAPIAPAESPAHAEPASVLDSLPLPATVLAPVQVDATYALPASPEPGYSAIAERVKTILLGVLEGLALPEHHQGQADALKARIEVGLNWYELVPALEDLAVILLAAAGGQQEFERYLKQLNERLAAFQDTLSHAHTDYADSLTLARELDSELRQQVDGLHSSVQQASDLASLKSLVESRLESLLGTLDIHQQQRQARDEEVAGRLQALLERVASMEQEASSFRDHLEEQRRLALLDTLTGLPNRAAWNERLDQEHARWQRHGGELLLAVLDIDHFKRINDGFGHLAGDKVLKIVAAELKRRLRKSDFIARFGGEELVLLLPETPLQGGLQLLENLRTAIEACPFHFKGQPLTITLSAGLTAFRQGERSLQAFERADQALYRAKQGGRNRIESL